MVSTSAPLVVVVVARLQEHFKVPKSEQLITAGCAAHAIELAAYAQGIGAVWRTGRHGLQPAVINCSDFGTLKCSCKRATTTTTNGARNGMARALSRVA